MPANQINGALARLAPVAGVTWWEIKQWPDTKNENTMITVFPAVSRTWRLQATEIAMKDQLPERAWSARL